MFGQYFVLRCSAHSSHEVLGSLRFGDFDTVRASVTVTPHEPPRSWNNAKPLYAQWSLLPGRLSQEY